MPIAKITAPGLTAIGMSVGLLWGCIVCERAMVRRALTDRAQVVRAMERLQRKVHSEPVSLPSPHGRRRVGVTAG
jgi:hypothetical protein